MVVALTLMNVLKINISVALALNVSTDQDHTSAFARQDTTETHIMANVQLHRDAALQTENVEVTKNVFNPENVFAHRHSFWIPVTATNVKIHVNDTLAELMPNVHRLIHHNVCVKLVSRVIRCKAVLMKMNVQLMELHVHMEHNVLIRKEDTNAYVPTERLVIHIKKDVFWIELISQLHVKVILIVLILWLAFKEHALVHARVCFADKTHTANQKDMQLGADAALVLLKTKAANVYHNVMTISAVKERFVL